MLHASLVLLITGCVCATAPVAAAGGTCVSQWSDRFGSPELQGTATTLLPFDDGTGERLYIGGAFVVPALGVSGVARYDGHQLEQVGAGLQQDVAHLSVYDFGGGARLTAVGSWGLLPGTQLAQWSAGAWQPGPPGLPASWAASLCEFQGALFVATPVGGVLDTYMVRWNGAAWVEVAPALGSAVLDMAAFDDGTGPALYMAGAPFVQGVPGTAGIARWRGGAMEAVGTGINGHGHALAVFDDGTGPALYVGGEFTTAGGAPAARVARWRDGAWSSVGAGFNKAVLALQVWDDGNGPALYAAGQFTQSGGAPVSRIARWNGGAWVPLGTGVGDGEVRDLAVFDDDGDGPTPSALYAVGTFTSAGGNPSFGIARWSGCGSACPADLNGDAAVNGADLGLLLAMWGGPGAADLNGDGTVNGADLGAMLGGWGACMG